MIVQWIPITVWVWSICGKNTLALKKLIQLEEICSQEDDMKAIKIILVSVSLLSILFPIVSAEDAGNAKPEMVWFDEP